METRDIQGGGFEVEGCIFKVRVTPRGKRSPLLQCFTEDDGKWYEMGPPIDAFWLQEMISVLKIVQLAPMVAKGKEEDLKRIREIALRSKKRGV